MVAPPLPSPKELGDSTDISVQQGQSCRHRHATVSTRAPMALIVGRSTNAVATDRSLERKVREGK